MKKIHNYVDKNAIAEAIEEYLLFLDICVKNPDDADGHWYKFLESSEQICRVRSVYNLILLIPREGLTVDAVYNAIIAGGINITYGVNHNGY